MNVADTDFKNGLVVLHPFIAEVATVLYFGQQQWVHSVKK